jgi:hypothetical protein
MTTNKTVKRRKMSKDKKEKKDKKDKKKHTLTSRRHRHKKSRNYLWKDYAYESNGIINNTTNNISNMDKPVNIVNGLRDYLALQNKEKIHK